MRTHDSHFASPRRSSATRFLSALTTASILLAGAGGLAGCHEDESNKPAPLVTVPDSPSSSGSDTDMQSTKDADKRAEEERLRKEAEEKARLAAKEAEAQKKAEEEAARRQAEEQARIAEEQAAAERAAAEEAARQQAEEARDQEVNNFVSTPQPSERVYYHSCKEARNAGAAPLYRGDPGYRDKLDRDQDGIACE